MSDSTDTDTQQPPTGGEEPKAVTCAFPNCTNEPEPKDPTKTGPAPRYCVLPEHNSVSAFRAKRAAKAGGASAASGAAEPEISSTPVTDAMSAASKLRGQLEQKIDELLTDLPRYLQEMRDAGDPEAAGFQIDAITGDANSKVAQANKNAADEKALRLAAVKRADIAEEAKDLAEEAAGKAIDLLDAKTLAYDTELAELRAKEKQRQGEHDALVAELTSAEETRAAEHTGLLEKLATAEGQRTAEHTELLEKLRAEHDEKVRQLQADAEARIAKAEAEANGRADKAVAEKETAQGQVAAAEKIARDAVATAEASKTALTSLADSLKDAGERTKTLEKSVDEHRSKLDTVTRERNAVEQQAGTAAIEIARLNALLEQHGITAPRQA